MSSSRQNSSISKRPGSLGRFLEQIIAHADIVGEDPAGRPIMRFEFVCPPWLMDKLAAYGAAGEDMEPEPEDYDSKRLAMGLCR